MVLLLPCYLVECKQNIEMENHSDNPLHRKINTFFSPPSSIFLWCWQQLNLKRLNSFIMSFAFVSLISFLGKVPNWHLWWQPGLLVHQSYDFLFLAYGSGSSLVPICIWPLPFRISSKEPIKKWLYFLFSV